MTVQQSFQMMGTTNPMTVSHRPESLITKWDLHD